MSSRLRVDPNWTLQNLHFFLLKSGLSATQFYIALLRIMIVCAQGFLSLSNEQLSYSVYHPVTQ
jgi:hypothetical protein